jgi:hypothetical protein
MIIEKSLIWERGTLNGDIDSAIVDWIMKCLHGKRERECVDLDKFRYRNERRKEVKVNESVYLGMKATFSRCMACHMWE